MKPGIVLLTSLLLALFLLHLPFLRADPDINLSDSRDAFTDEGLNTSQLRNFINHGHLDFSECDNLVKTPLFNAILFLPLKIFGTHLIVARLTILLFLFAVSFFILQNAEFKNITIILALTTLLQYYVFQYSHFSLSEMLSTGWILLAVFFLYQFFESDFRKSKPLFLSSLFIALSYYSKIQFLYMIPLIPVSLFLQRISSQRKTGAVIPSVKIILQSIGWAIVFVAIYLLAWYLPHKNIFNYVMHDEASGKFSSLMLLPKNVAFNIVCILFSRSTWVFNLLALLCFIAGSILWFRSEDRKFKFLFLISTVWVLLELHKLSMTYLPSRYLVSYYFAAGFLSSVVLAKMIFSSKEEKKFFSGITHATIGFVLAMLFLIDNGYDYTGILSRRQYNILHINNYFSNTLGDSNQLVMGPWAPSLAWDSKVICKPVWRNFMNDKNIFEQHPRVILSEPDEQESNQAYSSEGIHLSDHADSIREFQVGRWKVNAYWIKKE